MKILVTGAAGFIGFHLIKKLLKIGFTVVGLDNINDYYDKDVKYGRLDILGVEKSKTEKSEVLISSEKYSNFHFIKQDLQNSEKLNNLFFEQDFSVVCNLAAQAGVRYSIENPRAYIDSNIVGFLNVLECCRHFKIKHLIYASSSSVYGNNKSIPFSTNDNVDHPISLYAASKKSNELMAYTYSHLYNLPTSGLRFFTVYGPWGRPDMAIYLFTKSIIEQKEIKIFNHGNMMRDFTYIDDIISGIEIVLNNPPKKSKVTPAYQLFNVGNGSPESLLDFVKAIENAIGLEANKNFSPMQPGDVSRTWADITDLEKLGYKSSVGMNEGVIKFVEWYRQFLNSKVKNDQIDRPT